MKKLRMIVTFAIVLVIVGSSFAFNAKKMANFCVSTDLIDHHCAGLVLNKKIATVGTDFLYYTNWDGDRAKCVTTSTQCATAVTLVND